LTAPRLRQKVQFMSRHSALIVGAGEGIGAALTQELLAADLNVALVRRDAQALERLTASFTAADRVKGFALDAAEGEGVETVLDEAESQLGPLELVVYNVADYVMGPVLELSPEQFQSAARITHGAFLTGRAAARRMQARGRGTILFTTSTASLRGRVGNAALASARFALRGLVECLAREMAPIGVHVALIVLDSMIDTPALRAAMPDAAERYGPDRLMPTRAVAEHCLQLHRQPAGAWTFHSELRPRAAEW
jgi:NAD(P)-dependent dehydrogenase (short-subunit alcohol dehydrogenase family)